MAFSKGREERRHGELKGKVGHRNPKGNKVKKKMTRHPSNNESREGNVQNPS